MGVFLYICLGLVALVGYLIYSLPIPKGYNSPWTLRFYMAVFNVFKFRNYVRSFYTDPAEIMKQTRQLLKDHLQKTLNHPVETSVCHFDGVMVKMYRPQALKAAGNCGLVYYHGGGWCVGDIESVDDFCSEMAFKTNAVVVSIEYRLAPENVYPAALDDCVSATVHFLKNAETFNVNPDRIAIFGDSAGGNLTAATAMKLRDMKIKPQPRLQILIYPCLQAIDFKSCSYQANDKDPILNRNTMAQFWLFYATGNVKYLQDVLNNDHTPLDIKKQFSLNQLNHDIVVNPGRDRHYVPYQYSSGKPEVWDQLKDTVLDPFFAPLMAKDLSGLPEAVVVTAEQDVLRDDGIWYAKYLRSFGVEVTHRHFESGFHGFISLPGPHQKDTADAQRFIQEMIEKKL